MDRWIALDPLYTLSLTSFLSLFKWKFSNTQHHLVVKRVASHHFQRLYLARSICSRQTSTQRLPSPIKNMMHGRCRKPSEVRVFVRRWICLSIFVSHRFGYTSLHITKATSCCERSRWLRDDSQIMHVGHLSFDVFCALPQTKTAHKKRYENEND